jgi:hypothetical protein
MRDISKVIDEMLDIIPDFELKIVLVDLRDSIHFRAPETQWVDWLAAVNILDDFIGEPKLDWHHRVKRIFNDAKHS